MTKEKSQCCNSEMRIDGDDTEGTHYYVCCACNKPCDPQKSEGWVERFDNTFYEGNDNVILWIKDSQPVSPCEIEDFIRSEISKAVEGERKRIMDILIKEGYLKSRDILPKEILVDRCGCCYCHDCGRHNDYCVCSSNRLLKSLTKPQ